MGKGLQRIAALTASATAGLMALGAIEVGALVSAPTVTTTVPQLTVTAPETTVTVPETTVTVPSTTVSPKTTVTTPTVKTPPPPAPKVSTPQVTTPRVSGPSGASGSGSDSTTQKIVSGVTGTVGGGSAGGGSSGGSASPTGAVTDALSTGTSALGSGGGGAGAGAASASSGSSALQALGFFGGTGGAGGPAGPGGAGASNVFAAGGRSGGLPPTLTAAQAKQLRSALSLLEGCMSAIAPLDRQVLAMRAGTGRAGPLSRGQVAARLGVPARQVRLSERRGLSGLRTAAAETGCAGAAGGPFAVAGIAMSPLLAFATVNPGGAAAAPAGAGSGGYIAAREAGPAAESPLARLADGGESGPAWLIVLVTVLFSVAVAALMRELRTSVGAPRY